MRELHPTIENTFKDYYVLEFLGLPPDHSEASLQKALIRHMKQFILELGGDFIFMGEEFRLQVGNQDFFIDLLFYHRGLSALVAFELKIGKFSPEHLGELSFYLEALDRDVKKMHENPSIGVLLCETRIKKWLSMPFHATFRPHWLQSTIFSSRTRNSFSPNCMNFMLRWERMMKNKNVPQMRSPEFRGWGGVERGWTKQKS